MKKLLLIGFIILCGLVLLYFNKPTERKKIGVVNSTEFTFNGKTIKTEYTDNNIDENLIMRTDKSHYGGWDSAEVYFSIENVSKNTEIADIQFYFAGEEIIADISELKKDVPYTILVNDYGLKEYSCEKNWIATTTNELDKETILYACLNEIRYCDSVDGLICSVNNDLIGTREEIKYKDQWDGLLLLPSKKLTQAISADFHAKKRIGYNIPSGEIRFFKAIINFEPKSEGEFLILAEGLTTKGKLD